MAALSMELAAPLALRSPLRAHARLVVAHTRCRVRNAARARTYAHTHAACLWPRRLHVNQQRAQPAHALTPACLLVYPTQVIYSNFDHASQPTWAVGGTPGCS